MVIKNTLLLMVTIVVFFSCSEKEQIIEFHNLQEYLASHNDKQLDEVIACAASKEANNEVSFVFYYPIEGAYNIQYFETQNTNNAKNDFTLYTRIALEKEPVFNGYLERFIRNGATESWCVVTYETEGKVHVSNPIRLKNATKPTEWSNTISIDKTTPLMPEFVWQDGEVDENVIYFQVLSEANNDFVSGTYTFDQSFQFYNLDNVVLNITTASNPILTKDETYQFTMMGVSEDNWVNLVIQNTFTTE